MTGYPLSSISLEYLELSQHFHHPACLGYPQLRKPPNSHRMSMIAFQSYPPIQKNLGIVGFHPPSSSMTIQKTIDHDENPDWLLQKDRSYEQ